MRQQLTTSIMSISGVNFVYCQWFKSFMASSTRDSYMSQQCQFHASFITGGLSHLWPAPTKTSLRASRSQLLYEHQWFNSLTASGCSQSLYEPMAQNLSFHYEHQLITISGHSSFLYKPTAPNFSLKLRILVYSPYCGQQPINLPTWASGSNLITIVNTSSFKVSGQWPLKLSQWAVSQL